MNPGMLMTPNSSHNLNINSQNGTRYHFNCITNLMHRNLNHDSSRSSSSNSKNNQFGNIIDESILINDELIQSRTKHRSRSKTLNQTHFIAEELKNTYERNFKKKLSEEKIINILNNFVFILFLIFIVALHLISLIILPYFIKTPLTIED